MSAHGCGDLFCEKLCTLEHYICMYVSVCICSYIYVCIFVCIFICKHIYICIYIYVCHTQGRMDCSARSCAHSSTVHVCKCVYIYVCICTYACVYMYMYMYMSFVRPPWTVQQEAVRVRILYTYLCVYICIHMYVYIFLFACMCVYIKHVNMYDAQPAYGD